jgi:hypothetical protein
VQSFLVRKQSFVKGLVMSPVGGMSVDEGYYHSFIAQNLVLETKAKLFLSEDGV